MACMLRLETRCSVLWLTSVFADLQGISKVNSFKFSGLQAPGGHRWGSRARDNREDPQRDNRNDCFLTFVMLFKHKSDFVQACSFASVVNMTS